MADSSTKISELPFISLSASQYTPDSTLGRLTLVGDYLGDGDVNDTGIASGLEFAQCTWDYMTFVPEGEEGSLLSNFVDTAVYYAVDEAVGPAIVSYISSLEPVTYYTDYKLAMRRDYDGALVIADTDVGRYFINNELARSLETQVGSLIDDSDVLTFVHSDNMSQIFGISVGDLVDYIKSHA